MQTNRWTKEKQHIVHTIARSTKYSRELGRLKGGLNQTKPSQPASQPASSSATTDKTAAKSQQQMVVNCYVICFSPHKRSIIIKLSIVEQPPHTKRLCSMFQLQLQYTKLLSFSSSIWSFCVYFKRTKLHTYVTKVMQTICASNII